MSRFVTFRLALVSGISWLALAPPVTAAPAIGITGQIAKPQLFFVLPRAAIPALMLSGDLDKLWRDFRAARERATTLMREQAEALHKLQNEFQSEPGKELPPATAHLYEQKRLKLLHDFTMVLRPARATEIERRKQATEAFERYLKTTPEDPKSTPEVMLALGELYLEGAQEVESTDESQPLDKPVAAYRWMLGHFPQYRFLDAAFYELGWCLTEQGEPQEAAGIFQELVAKFPKSTYAPEAWVRLGQHEADELDSTPENLRAAIEAYRHAAAFADSPLHLQALRGIATTSFREGRYDEAIEGILAVIAFVHGPKAPATDVAGELEKDALRYLALAYASEHWGAEHSPAKLFHALEVGGYLPDFFRQLGEA